MNLVQDKVTIITGGTRGIGFAAAKIFIDNGAKVSIFGETQEEVDTALAQLKELYPEEEVLGFAPDLTSRDAVMAAHITICFFTHFLLLAFSSMITDKSKRRLW